MGIFDEINSDSYRVDMIRKNIILPYLYSLGYTELNFNRRVHNLRYSGNKKTKGKFPDFLIQINGRNAFSIDAINPDGYVNCEKVVEKIRKNSKSKLVNIEIFVICNGIEVAIFHVKKKKPLLLFNLNCATEEDFINLFGILNPFVFMGPMKII